VKWGCWCCLVGLVTRNEAVCIICGLGYAKWVLASSGGMITRDEVVCVVLGFGYMKWRCWQRMGAGLCETRQFALFGGRITRNGGVGVVWEFSSMKRAVLYSFFSLSLRS
jgi:hypothetical protein